MNEYTSIEDTNKDMNEITFDSLGLSDQILKSIEKVGYVTPTPIQVQTIPLLLEGKDVVGIAQTGTGKTAAFALPILEKINPNAKNVQALILAPTRELAMQSANAMDSFLGPKSKVKVVAVYGGSSYTPQIEALKSGAQIVVGTPGRIMDLMEKKALDLTNVSFLVLDEADEMLRMGFAEDVENIVTDIPNTKQTALFSATMPEDIRKIANNHLNNPTEVSITKQSTTTKNIHQTYAVVPFKHKVGALSRVLSVKNYGGAIVFVRTRATAEEVAIELGARGIMAATISGDVPQRERERLVERIKNGSLNILVATDVAARGIDIERVGLVVNFDVPRENEAYVHRIGRTGRAGRKGEALTFLTPKESYKLRQIEKLTGAKLEEVAIPTPKDVSEHKAKVQMENISQRVTKPRLELYKEIFTSFCQTNDISPVDAAAAMLALTVGDEGPSLREEKNRIRYEESVDENGEFISAVFEEGRDKSSRKSSRGAGAGYSSRERSRAVQEGFTRYRIEVGRKDNVSPGEIVGAMAGESSLKGSQIGRIDILPTFTLVDVNQEISGKDMRRLQNTQVRNRSLLISLDEGPKTRSSNRGGRGRISSPSKHYDNIRVKRKGKDFIPKGASKKVKKNKKKR